MACTILTVPFDLVENEKGEFLKKGLSLTNSCKNILETQSIIRATYMQ